MELNEKIGQELTIYFNSFSEKLHSNSKLYSTFEKGIEEANYRMSDKGQSLLTNFLNEKVNVILKDLDVKFTNEERENFNKYMTELIVELKAKFPFKTVKEIM